MKNARRLVEGADPDTVVAIQPVFYPKEKTLLRVNIPLQDT
jgi:hypothetical protein